MSSRDRLLNILEKSFFNVLVFHYEELNFMFASSESMRLFGVKDSNAFFSDIFPHIDVNKLRNDLESSKTGSIITQVLDEYVTEISKINLKGLNLLVLSLSLKNKGL